MKAIPNHFVFSALKWSVFLLISVAIHLLLLLIKPLPLYKQKRSIPLLVMRLPSPVLPLPAIPQEDKTQSTLFNILPAPKQKSVNKNLPDTTKKRAVDKPVSAPLDITTSPSNVETAPTSEAILSVPRVLPESNSLLESAQQTARQMVQQESRSSFSTSTQAPPKQALMPSLERAMASPVASEKVTNDGTVKVTTTAGTTYCLKPPPDVIRDGPTKLVSIPLVCNVGDLFK